MIRTFSLDPGDKPSKEQLKEVQEAKNHPIVFDEDCPELSPALIKAYKASTEGIKHRKKA